MNFEFDNMDKYKHIHLIGIGGISMSAIAETMKSFGYTVTGSDRQQSSITDNLISTGIPVVIGSDLENSKKADLIVYSAAIKEDDPEIITAKENDVCLVDRGTFVGYLTKKYKESICISGTHGKTTTTSMISLCFLEAKYDPTIQVGAILKQIDGNYKIGNSDYFILEACEYKRNFLKFFPKTEVVLNIDNDHLDYFKTFENIKNTFIDYAKLLPSDGILVTNADDKNCLELLNNTKATCYTYAINNKDANYIAEDIVFDENGFAKYKLYKDGKYVTDIKLSVAGMHNVLNSLACIAVCLAYKIDIEVIKSALSKFTGAHRRLEYVGTYNGANIFDDYGHHPTEINATCNAIKNKSYNKSWVIFQPHTYSRTKNHLNEFAEALTGFDNIIVTDIYAARETNTFGISSLDLVNKIKELGKEAIYIKDFKEIENYIKNNVEKNDLVLTLGAGTVLDIGYSIVK